MQREDTTRPRYDPALEVLMVRVMVADSEWRSSIQGYTSQSNLAHVKSRK